MATHSTTFTWKIPWTEELDGLPSMGSYRVRQDWSDSAAAAAVRKSGSQFSLTENSAGHQALLPPVNLLLLPSPVYGAFFFFYWKLPSNSVVKNLPEGDSGDAISIPGLGLSPRERNDNSVQYFCLGNLMDRGAWGWAIMGSQRVGHPKLDMTEHTHIHTTLLLKKKICHMHGYISLCISSHSSLL